MTTDNRACKNCTFFTDRHDCTKGTTFLLTATDGSFIATTPHRNSVCAKHELRQGLPKVFYIRPTTCADCHHFLAEPIEYEATENFEAEVIPAGCDNGCEMCISVAPEKYRPMQASDQACEEHITEQEVKAEEEWRERELQREEAVAAAARQSEASAERLTMQVLGRLRKGGAL